MFGLVAILGSTLMLCFGRAEPILIFARVLQGISAAVVWTVGKLDQHMDVNIGLALIVDTVGEARTGQAMAYVSSAMSIALILGPLLGGIIYSQKGYYASFGVAFAFIGLDLVLRVILVEKKVAARYASAPQQADVEASSVKSQNVPTSLAIPQSSQERPPVFTPATTPNDPNTHRNRIPPIIRILKYPRLLVALLLAFVQALLLSAFDATLPLYLNSLFSFTAFQAGTSNNFLI